ncbi:MAG: thioredoxin family protein [Anaerolineaceae bacterium]|nr:thioredoxin family protein [Anaerolineaceae bacterium]
MSPSNPKNRKADLLTVLQHKPSTQIPWVPFAGVHVGKLTGHNASEILQDADKLYEALLEANHLYAPDGQPVVFDLQIEAEILGCELLWAEESPPTVATHPLQHDYLIPTYIPTPEDGRLPIVLNVMRRMKTAVGEHTLLYGLITGPFTLASHLRGTEIFMDMIDEPEYVSDLLEYCTRFVEKVASLYIAAGMDVIAVVDPMISQISPRHFKRFMSEPFTQLFKTIREQKVFSAFFVCGDATKNLEVMCQTGPDCIAVDENIDMVYAQSILSQYNITLQGNIPLTTRMLLGTQEDNMQYVIELLDKLDHHNLIISPGCDMPYDTPVENVIGVAEAIRNPEQTRRILENYQQADMDLSHVEIPDYPHLEKPLLEVFTLDSASCAACSYMLLAAERATQAMGGKIDMVEYKMTTTENIARLKKMGIQNLPSIVINGELKFSSLIPGQQELIETIQEFLVK